MDATGERITGDPADSGSRVLRYEDRPLAWTDVAAVVAWLTVIGVQVWEIRHLRQLRPRRRTDADPDGTSATPAAPASRAGSG